MAESTNLQVINSFNGGINTDLDDSLIPNTSYRDAVNMRVVSDIDGASSALQPFAGFESKADEYYQGECIVISTVAVRNFIVSFKLLNDPNLLKNVFRIERYDTLTNTNYNILSSFITHDYTSDIKFSVVSRYEDDDNIKVYWTDNTYNHPIRMINIADVANTYNANATDVEVFNIKPLMTQNKPLFKSFVPGYLKNGKIQYCYFFYNDNGQQTEVSVPSELIHLSPHTDNQVGFVKGGKYDELSNKGVSMSIGIPADNTYRRIKIISVFYDTNNESPVIKVILDNKLIQGSTIFEFIDFGSSVLQELTIDEFNLLSGINFTARYLEHKNNYLFAGNIKKVDWDVDFDARAYRSNKQGYAYLDSSVGNPLIVYLQNSNGDFDPKSSPNGTAVVIPDDHDCINPYNDLNKEYVSLKDRGTFSTTSTEGAPQSIPLIFENLYQDSVTNTTSATALEAGSTLNITPNFKGNFKMLFVNQRGVDSPGPVISDEVMYLAVYHGTYSSYLDTLNLTPVSKVVLTSDLNKEYVSGLSFDAPNIPYTIVSYRRATCTPNIDQLGDPISYSCGLLTGIGDNDDWGLTTITPIIKELQLSNPGNIKTDIDDKYSYIRTYNENKLTGLKYGGIGPNIKYEFIWTDIELEESQITDYSGTTNNHLVNSSDIPRTVNTITDGLIPDGIYKYKKLTPKNFEGVWHYDQDGLSIHSRNIDGGYSATTKAYGNYSNVYIDMKYKSLHRDELYRYGIVFYNKYGVKSTVKWIGDIRTPHNADKDPLSEINGAYNYNFKSTSNNELISFESNGTAFATNVNARPLGIRFSIKNVDQEVDSYEIVRVKRRIADKSVLSQGYVTTLNKVDANGDKSEFYCQSQMPWNTYNTTFQWIVRSGYPSPNIEPFAHIGNTNGLDKAYQFISPDTCYAKENFDTVIKDGSLYVQYLHGMSSQINNGRVSNENSYKSWILGLANYNKSLDDYFNLMIGFNRNNGGTKRTLYNGTDMTYPALNTISAFSSIDNVDVSVGVLGFEATLSAIGRNSGKITEIESSTDLNGVKDYPDLDPTKATIINGKSIQNYAGGDHSVQVAQGPSSPALFFIIDQTGDQQFYLVGHVKPNEIKTNRQSTEIAYNPLIANINDAKVYNNPNDFMYYLKPQKSNYSTITYSVKGDASDIYPYLNFVNIVNLKHITQPYGGNTYSTRQFSNYTSISAIGNIGNYRIKPKGWVSGINTIDTFNGDTYICLFDHNKLHSVGRATTDADREAFIKNRAVVNVRIPLETSINLCLSSGQEIHKGAPYDTQIEPTSIPNGTIQEIPEFVYNGVYSTESTVVIDTVKGELEQYNKKLDTRVVYSEQKINDELQDSWTMFKANNFLEMDNRYGALTNLKLFKNQLLVFQENALAVLAVKDRSVITDGNIAPLVLGTGDVLERYDYVTTNYGIYHDQSKNIVESDSFVYWFDKYRNEILAYNGQLVQLSKRKLIQNHLNKSSVLSYPIALYNKKTNEVMFNMFDNPFKPTITFNEQTDSFTSFYTLPFIGGEQVNGELYILKDTSKDSAIRHSIATYDENLVNKFVDVYGSSYIKYIINDNYDFVKVFDNAEFNGIYKGTKTEIYYTTDGKDTYTINSEDIENRETSFKYAIPRIVSSEDIPDRNRGHVTQCTFAIDTAGKLFKIPYFKTKYRTSKS